LLPIARRRNNISIDKSFIITELDLDELEVELTEKIEIFIEEKLGKLASKQTEVLVEYQEYMNDNMRCFKDEFRSELWASITFNKYTYKNEKMSEPRTESLDIQFDYKGRQPFYIDGKFVSMNVFEWISCCPIQKTEVVYGVKKDDLREMIDDLIMTC